MKVVIFSLFLFFVFISSKVHQLPFKALESKHEKNTLGAKAGEFIFNQNIESPSESYIKFGFHKDDLDAHTTKEFFGEVPNHNGKFVDLGTKYYFQFDLKSLIVKTADRGDNSYCGIQAIDIDDIYTIYLHFAHKTSISKFLTFKFQFENPTKVLPLIDEIFVSCQKIAGKRPIEVTE